MSNAHLHPIFQRALAPWMPPAPARRYVVTVGQRDRVRLLLECTAPDSSTAVEQHLHLSLPLERVEARLA